MANNLFADAMDLDRAANEGLDNQTSQSDEMLLDNFDGNIPVQVNHVEGASAHINHVDGAMDGNHQGAVSTPLLPPAEHDGYPNPCTQVGEPSLHFETAEPSTAEGSKVQGFSLLPDFTQQPITDVSEIQALYNAYVQSFSDPSTSNETHLEHAKPLITALLSHYYPKSQGFTVEDTTFSVMGKYGWPFWLYPEDYDPQAAIAKSKSKKKGAKPFAPAFDTFAVKYCRIEPEHITGFVVLSLMKFENEDGTTETKYIPHTYLGIMMNNLESFDKWVPEELQTGNYVVTNPRCELLSFSLGQQAQIREGYGILLLGPRIEFYNYDQDSWNKTKDTSFLRLTQDGWAVDMRTHGLGDVDKLFRGFCERDVVYQGGFIGLGPKAV